MKRDMSHFKKGTHGQLLLGRCSSKQHFSVSMI